MIFEQFPRWIDGLIPLVKEAGAEILRIRGGELDIREKTDRSPVTVADARSHQIIVEGLGGLSPGFPVISEEGVSAPWSVRRRWEQLWMVDPLDGTREFIAGRDDFTINVAFISCGDPVLGVLHHPVSGQTLVAYRQNAGLAWIYYGCDSTDHCFSLGADALVEEQECKLRVLVSHQYGDGDIVGMPRRLSEAFQQLEIKRFGSAWKFGCIAKGLADFYVRCAPTCEWDTAAGQALLTACGGGVCDMDGNPLRYNRSASLINPGFYAYGPRIDKTMLTNL